MIGYAEQDLETLVGSAGAGDSLARRELSERLGGICQKASSWQWVIHGETAAYRECVVRWLVDAGRYVGARRFALCGRGDVLCENAKGKLRVRPRGCGARFCPRCSRRAGRRGLSRVAAHLSTREHGNLFHVVLTQRVVPDETLDGARLRFEAAWKRFYTKLRRAGMTAALATYHLTPSARIGWHYHCHLLMEFDGLGEDDATEGLAAAWHWACGETDASRVAPFFCRMITGAGGPLSGLANDTQMEFFEESRNPVEVCLQYIVRDILQGVESWVGRINGRDRALEFVATLTHCKTHRLYGEWRKPVPKDGTEKADEDADAEDETAFDPKLGRLVNSAWKEIGMVDAMVRWIRSGEKSWLSYLTRLLGHRSQKGALTSRLFRLVSALAA